LPPGHPTVASLLKGNGYETGAGRQMASGVGSLNSGRTATASDEFFGILSGAAGLIFTHPLVGRAGWGPRPGGVPDLFENLTPIERAGLPHDLLSEKPFEIVGRPRTNRSS